MPMRRDVSDGAEPLSPPRPPAIPFGSLWARIEEVRRRSANPQAMFWMYAVNYRIGAAIVLLVRSTPVTANWLTAASLAVHVATAAAVALLPAPAPPGAAVLVLLFWQLAVSLDCADGPLARERGEAGPFGAWLDEVFDFLAHLATATGVVILLVRALAPGPLAAAALMAGVGGANLFHLHGLVLKNLHLGDSRTVSPADSPRYLLQLRRARHVLDSGFVLCVTALLLLAPQALLAYTLLNTAMASTWMAATVGRYWQRHGRPVRHLPKRSDEPGNVSG